MSLEDIQAQLDEFDDRLSAVEDKVESIGQVAVGLDSDVEELNNAVEVLREADAEIRQEVDRVDDRTDLLQQVKQASAKTKEQKIAVCLMTLRQRAERQGGSATMDADGCLNALGGDIDRTSTYDILKDAEDIVDTDAVYYVSEPRSSKRNSRLVMDLDEGDLPPTVAGHDITAGGEA